MDNVASCQGQFRLTPRRELQKRIAACLNLIIRDLDGDLVRFRLPKSNEKCRFFPEASQSFPDGFRGCFTGNPILCLPTLFDLNLYYRIKSLNINLCKDSRFCPLLRDFRFLDALDIRIISGGPKQIRAKSAQSTPFLERLPKPAKTHPKSTKNRL